LKSEIAVGEFWRISGEKMIISNCIALRAKSFKNRQAVGESEGLLLQLSQVIKILLKGTRKYSPVLSYIASFNFYFTRHN